MKSCAHFISKPVNVAVKDSEAAKYMAKLVISNGVEIHTYSLERSKGIWYKTIHSLLKYLNVK